MQFDELQLDDLLLRAVKSEGYTSPTPIQENAIPHVLAGRDVIGCAQTGTGKTAAFALPILQNLGTKSHTRYIRVLVLSPTRELAAQIGENFKTYGQHTPLKQTVIFGGVGQHPQAQDIKNGVDILVATPGRLLDLMNQGIVKLDRVEVFVLDEADQMLDMGFINDMKRVIKHLPKKRQTLLFSATMPQSIQDLADEILINPVFVEVNPHSSTAEKIDQSVFLVESGNKRNLLKHLLDNRDLERVLVFMRTKHRANNLAKQISRGKLKAEAIHGNKSQTARTRALKNFKDGRTRVLIATDIASRGLDINDVTHVVNFDLPNIPESYVHRIGRTARADASGIAYSFVSVEERAYLKDIEKLIGEPIPIIEEHPFVSDVAVSEPIQEPKKSKGKSGNSRNNNNRRRNRNPRRKSKNKPTE
ncbi:MAG: DEAD/DEAH box helicase [Phototrophicaceae bacterium]